MAIAKVILNGETLMDVTQKTVTESTLLSGITALGNDGTDITGTLVPGGGGGSVTPLTVMPASEQQVFDAAADVETHIGEIYVSDADHGRTFPVDLSSFSAGDTCRVTGTLYGLSGGAPVNRTDVGEQFAWPVNHEYTWTKGLFTLTVSSSGIRIDYSGSGGIYADPDGNDERKLHVYRITRSAFAGYNPVTVQGSPVSDYLKLISRSTALTSFSNDEITEIGRYAFAQCTKLQSVSFPNCTGIGSYAFLYCSELSDVSFPKCVSIYSSAFYACASLSTVTFPVCTTVWDWAFYFCSRLTSVSFPKCYYVGNAAFSGCSRLQSVSMSLCTYLSNNAFSGCYELSTAVFPVCSVIGASAFMNCRTLETVSFPFCNSIYSSAFYGCSALESAVFPSCTVMSSGAFGNCFSLAAASFPVLMQFPSYAFRNCYRLLSLYVGLSKSSVVSLTHSAVFQSTPFAGYCDYTGGSMGTIYVPASLLSDYQAAANWSFFSSLMAGV